MRGLLAAIGFLTRLPVPVSTFDDARAQSSSLAWYPLVGLLLGGWLCGLAWLVHGWPPMLSAAVLLLAWVVSTGGLHLDGLADSADAWVGGLGDRERTLTIMKDPRSGPAGVSALILLLLTKFAALASVTTPLWSALLLAPLLARSALTLAFLSIPYVRSGGLGSGLVDAPRLACMVGLLCAAVVCVAFGWRGGLALLCTLMVFIGWRHACRKRLGGMTGDTCGALTELVEVVVLIALTVSA
ncbi:adenosylcobinamide-GDP ribazoletransferase [Dyella silvatica]|uniref:adenosylcobinamide-GDP ribazoletransferase n=1 Tax=Dyella silvatica TaxID=2992128 RepID=UPI00225A61BB|nr:adenosylcobinamide-GDP ribazoletransferase [Dyella silvatica]